MVLSQYVCIFGLFVCLSMVHILRCDDPTSDVTTTTMTVNFGGDDENTNNDTDDIMDNTTDISALIKAQQVGNASTGITKTASDGSQKTTAVAPILVQTTTTLISKIPAAGNRTNSVAGPDSKGGKKGKGGLPPGWVAFIVISVIAVLLTVVIVAVILVRRRKQMSQETKVDQPVEPSIGDEPSPKEPSAEPPPESEPPHKSSSMQLLGQTSQQKENSQKEASTRENLMSAKEAQSLSREPPKQLSIRKLEKSLLQMNKMPLQEPPKEAPKSLRGSTKLKVSVAKLPPKGPPKVVKDTSSSSVSTTVTTGSTSTAGSTSSRITSSREEAPKQATSLSEGKTVSKKVPFSPGAPLGEGSTHAPSSKGSFQAPSFSAKSIIVKSSSKIAKQ